MKYGLLYTFLALVAVIIVVIIFAIIGWDKIITKFWEVGLSGFLAYLIASILWICTPIIGWYLILHSHNIKASFLHTAIGQFIGNAISYITPSAYIGGEPVKAHYIGTLYNTSTTKVFSTGLFAAFQQFAALIIFIYAGTLVMVIEAESLQLPKGLWAVLLVADIILGVILLLSLRCIIRNSPVFSHLATWIAGKGILAKPIEKIVPKIINAKELIYLGIHYHTVRFVAPKLETINSLSETNCNKT